MAAQQFIGMTVVLTLREPKHIISGTVSAIVDQNLHLTNTFNWTLEAPTLSVIVNGTNIDNIEIRDVPPPAPVPKPAFKRTPQPPQPVPVPFIQNIPPPPPPPIVPAPIVHQAPPVTASSPFVDPAILAFKPSTNLSRKASPAHPSVIGAGLQRSPTAIPAAHLPQRPLSLRPESVINGASSSGPSRNENRPEVHGPRVNLPGRPELLRRTVSTATSATIVSKPSSTTLRERTDSNASTHLPDPFTSAPASGLSDAGQKTRTKPRGTRGRRLNRRRNEDETPLKEEPANGLAQNARRYKKLYHGQGEEEGWATEDVNDYRDTEFDFQGNLDKFDKKTVFSQIRAEDTTADEDLLVSHNRLPKKKNYAYNENVLGPKPEQLKPVLEHVKLNGRFEAYESEATAPEMPETRTRSKSRKSPNRRLRTRRSARPSADGTSSDSDISELQEDDGIPRVSTQEARKRSASRRRQFEYPFQVIKSRSKCPAVTIQQMQELEKAAEKCQIPHSIIIENAARGIAHVAMKSFVSKLKRSAIEDMPYVAIFAGAHFDGARAVAAGRHLRARGFSVYVFTTQQTGGKETYRHLRDQVYYFKLEGPGLGKVLGIGEDLGEIPVRFDIIVDAIVNRNKRLSDHLPKELKAIQKMISYANSLDAPCLSVNLPSGLSGFSGKPLTDCDTVQAERVVAIDAPTVGLAKALRSDAYRNVRVWVVESGVPHKAWTDAFGRYPKEKMDLGADWAVGIELAADSGPNSDAEEDLRA